MIISFLYNPFTNQPGHPLLKKTQSAQFAGAFNKTSLPRQTKPRLMNSSFRSNLEVSYAAGQADTSWLRETLDIFAGRAAGPAIFRPCAGGRPQERP
jgi:hypothetical protein